MTSRKLIICLLASMVMRSLLLLKTRHIYFLMFSVSLGDNQYATKPRIDDRVDTTAEKDAFITVGLTVLC